MRGVALLLLVAEASAFNAVGGVRAGPRLPVAVRAQAPIEGSDAAPPAPGSDLVAQSSGDGGGRRVAVSGLQPEQSSQQQQTAGVAQPAPAPVPAGPSLMQKAKAPFMGLTIVAVAAVTSWQSKIKYAQRQEVLLEEFAATMVFHQGDEREMDAALKSFRSQLGPGRYTGPMYTAFLKSLATNVPIGVKAVQDLKATTALFGLSDAALEKLLEQVADELKNQPSVLGKLTFLAERAMPQAAAMAKLRTKFPNWSFDTVTALQRAMVENLYRDVAEEGGTMDATSLAVLGLSEADAARLTQEVADRKAAEAAAEAEKLAEEERAKKLEEALIRASQDGAMTTRKTDRKSVV